MRRLVQARMAGGLSIRKTAARLVITVDKAFRWRHKFLGFLNGQKPSALSGVVEADETFFPVSYKGQKKGLPRTAKKRLYAVSSESWLQQEWSNRAHTMALLFFQ